MDYDGDVVLFQFLNFGIGNNLVLMATFLGMRSLLLLLGTDFVYQWRQGVNPVNCLS